VGGELDELPGRRQSEAEPIVVKVSSGCGPRSVGAKSAGYHDKVDVAIRARKRLQDEALTMRRLGTSRLIFVASPNFIASLASHPLSISPIIRTVKLRAPPRGIVIEQIEVAAKGR